MMKFWNNKRVLISGHTGFKGSWLTIWLTALGAKVTGLSLSHEKENNIISLSELNGKVVNVFGDINDSIFIEKTLKEVDPEIIIHMAAQPLVIQSYLDPIDTLNTNVLGTSKLLNEVYKLKKTGLSTKVFLNVTTDKVYKNREWVWGYREIDELGGNDPYSCSKACSELITSMFAKSFFQNSDISIASARAGNVVGGGDWSQNRLIPDCIKSLIKNEDTILRRPKSVRPWQHVVEPLAGYLLLAEYLFDKKINFDSWNFGSDQSHSVEYISDYLYKKWKPAKGSIVVKESPYEETNLLKLNSAKSEKEIGWKNCLKIESILDFSIDWYRDVLIKKKSSYEITLNQLVTLSNLFNKNSISI